MLTRHLIYLIIACFILFAVFSIKNESNKKNRKNRRHPMDRIEWLGTWRDRMQNTPCWISLYELDGEEYYQIYAPDEKNTGLFIITVYKTDGSVLFHFVENQTAANHDKIEDFYRKAVFKDTIWDHLHV